MIYPYMDKHGEEFNQKRNGYYGRPVELAMSEFERSGDKMAQYGYVRVKAKMPIQTKIMEEMSHAGNLS